jgi:dephospho-CoA kinase
LRRPFIIGLTGNIATGKSQVGQFLGELGALVIDADQVAHQAMEPGAPAYQAVVDAFGPEILAGNRNTGAPIDRHVLGGIVFRDPVALRRLEAAVHPAVIAEVNRQILAATESVVVVEAIKLIEAGMHHDYNALWVVTAPRSLQIERLMSSRGFSEDEAALRVDSQPPQGEKAALADWVIVNDGNMDMLRGEVLGAWRETLSVFPADLREQEAEMQSIESFAKRHPKLVAWAGLAVGMVAILVWAARDVGFEAGQWVAVIVATILLAGLCVWIVGWDGDDEADVMDGQDEE